MSEHEELLKELFKLVEIGKKEAAISFLNDNFKANSVDFELLEDYFYSANVLVVNFISENLMTLTNRETLHLKYLQSKAKVSHNSLVKRIYSKAALAASL